MQIVAACDFYTYIGHVAKGFIKLEGKLIFPSLSLSYITRNFRGTLVLI